MIDLAAILAWLVIVVAVPLNWLVVVLLWLLALRAPRVVVLRERAIAASAVAVMVTIFALVFVNNDRAVPVLDLATTKVITRGAILVLSVIPALFWLRLVYLGERP